MASGIRSVVHFISKSPVTLILKLLPKVKKTLEGLVDHVRLHRKKQRAGVVTSLLALGDQDNLSEALIQREIAKSIVSKIVHFASITRHPNILVNVDPGNRGESFEDIQFTIDLLTELFGNEYVRVHEGELDLEHIDNADVVYVINPGYPLSSLKTADTLQTLKAYGNVGIVLSGDDMSRTAQRSDLSDLTGVHYENNGVRACGVSINNNRTDNRYNVRLKKRHFRHLSKAERILKYGNDIDHVSIAQKGVRVFAHAKVKNGDCKLKIPVIFGYKIKENSSIYGL